MADEIEVPEGLYADIVSVMDAEQKAGPNPDEYWLGLASTAYTTSTDYLDANIRNQWEDSIAHQNNEHANGSKYLTDTYRARSKMFRPKTRTNNQAAEASFAKAMFSTTDLVSVEPENDNDPLQRVSADINGFLMQYRLSTSIKWYLTAMGAYQDARVYGVCASYQYWDFEEVIEDDPDDEPDTLASGLEPGNPATNEHQQYGQIINRPTGTADTAPMGGGEIKDFLPEPTPVSKVVRVLRDKPACDLLPPENVRFEPNADWRDPINTSPYVVRLVPKYADEAMQKIAANGWREQDINALIHAGSNLNERSDRTRAKRQGEDRQDPSDQSGTERNEFRLVWLHENFIRVGGQDYVFWTCGTDLLLSEPTPIEEVYPHLRHGERPITLGVCVIESHRNYPMSPTQLIAPLQEQSNDISNQRMDNVRLVLNKRYILKRTTGGGGIDMAALARSSPGSSVMTQDPEKDIRVLETNDVTSSSYQEQDRLDLAIDELSGTFSQQTVQNNRNLNETVGGMEMMNAGASDITEYAIRTFIETWVEPTLSQLVRLEQYYETDETIMAMAQESSKEYQQFGEGVAMDEMLRQELTINVNAGFGKTDPQKRLNSLNTAMQSVAHLPSAIARLDEDEIIKEIFGNAGYRDGKRFFKPMDEFKEEMKSQPPPQGDPVKMQELELKAQDMQFRHQMDQQKMQMEQERWTAEISMKREIEIMKMALDGDKTMAQIQSQLGLKESDNKTKRDIEAGKQTLEQARLINEQRNQQMGYDTYG
jgi:hypothetical protein